MGLGKTLSVLALICSSLDLENSEEDGEKRGKHRGTLIVAPMSSEFPLKFSKFTFPLTRFKALYGWETQIAE